MEEQKASNKMKAKTRCGVEHILGTFKTAMNGALKIRSIGMKRAEFSVRPSNLVYKGGLNNLKYENLNYLFC